MFIILQIITVIWIAVTNWLCVLEQESNNIASYTLSYMLLIKNYNLACKKEPTLWLH